MSENTMQKNDDLFRFIDKDTIQSEKITAPRYSYWASVFRVFFRKKVNIVLICLFVLLFLCVFIIPIFMPYSPYENVTDATTYHLSPAAAMNKFGGSLKWIFGTGSAGNSIFAGIMASARTSLVLAVICASINMTIGILLGAVWGYSKRFDQVMLVVYNIIANVPDILLITVLVYIIGSGFWSFVFALTVTGWLGIAYFFRTQVMIIRDRAGYISFEVFLTFIGAGLSADVPSLGRMVQEAQSAFITYPWEFWPPVSIAAAVTIILYVLGQNLADASDPRTHM